MKADDGDQRGEVVDLRSRAGFKPDMAALARAQVASARERLGLSHAEFAEVLKPLLGWAPTAGVVENWETSATPPGDVLIAAGVIAQSGPYESADRTGDTDPLAQLLGKRFADVDGVFATRSEFVAEMPITTLLAGATTVDAAGLSLNWLCQYFPGDELRHLIGDGTVFRCLFLAPYGKAIGSREHEEDYPQGHLSALTEMNIQVLTQRVRQRLPEDQRDRLKIATYDETIRFNIMTINGQLSVIQPYLPAVRGIESPTFVLHRQRAASALFGTFEQVFDWLWERSEPV